MASRKIRTFVGVALPAGTIAQLAVAQREMRKVADGLRVIASWEKPEKMHVTLKFLGDVLEARLDDLSRALDDVASRQRVFAFELEGVGGFPVGKSPQIVYAAITFGSEALASLAGEVDAAVAAFGIAPETRPFHGHVTLARVRKAPKSMRAATIAPASTRGGRVEVAQFRLYASTIEPSGSVHRVLSHHALIRDIRTDA